MNLKLIWPWSDVDDLAKLSNLTKDPVQINVTLNPGERLFTFDFDAHTGFIEAIDSGTYSMFVQAIDENGNSTHDGSANGVIVEADKETSVTVFMRTLPHLKLHIDSFDPDSLVEIKANPGDSTGVENGFTPLVLIYPPDAKVKLTPQEEASGKPFQKWKLDNEAFLSDRTITITMDQDRDITAIYGEPLLARFEIGSSCGISPYQVNFTNKSTGRITNYFWDFGDGNTSTETHPSHTYTVAGTYNVSLTASGFAGSDFWQASRPITIELAAPPASSFLRSGFGLPLDNGCSAGQNQAIWQIEWNPVASATVYKVQAFFISERIFVGGQSIPIYSTIFEEDLFETNYQYRFSGCVPDRSLGPLRIIIWAGRDGCIGRYWGRPTIVDWSLEPCNKDCS